MKKLFIAAMMLLCVSNVYVNAQNVKREGKTFSMVTSGKSSTKDTVLTEYVFIDSKGNQYPIIVNKASGRCYIWKTSGKTGKPYKMYMKKEISRTVCKETGIKYIESKKK